LYPFYFLGRPGGLRRARLSPRFFCQKKAKRTWPFASLAQILRNLQAGLPQIRRSLYFRKNKDFIVFDNDFVCEVPDSDPLYPVRV